MRHVPISACTGSAVFSFPDDPDVVRLRDRLLSVMSEAQEGTIVPLHLGECILNASCHAAVLGPVLEGVATGRFSGRYLVVHDPAGQNDWDADAALRKVSAHGRAKLVCVWETGDESPRLIGDVDPGVDETYRYVLTSETSGQPATTRGLAEMFNLKIQAASNRMTRAATLGVIRPSAEASGTDRAYLAVR